MKLSTSLVAVKKITSEVPRSNFSEDELNSAAKSIIEAEGIINPIVLRRRNLESYEVVSGDFEYHAATRAREIDPRKGEMIGAFIIESENEEPIKHQVELFRRPPSPDGPNPVELRLAQVEARQTNTESRIDSQSKEIKERYERDIQAVQKEIEKIKQNLPHRIEPLKVFNNADPSELISKFRIVGLTGKKATKIIDQLQNERKKADFKSLSDVVNRIQGLSAEKMVEIVDTWLVIVFLET